MDIRYLYIGAGFFLMWMVISVVAICLDGRQKRLISRYRNCRFEFPADLESHTAEPFRWKNEMNQVTWQPQINDGQRLYHLDATPWDQRWLYPDAVGPGVFKPVLYSTRGSANQRARRDLRLGRRMQKQDEKQAQTARELRKHKERAKFREADKDGLR